MEKVPGGYNGKILRVNLSENSLSTEPIDNTFCRKYLGGSGFISYFLLKELRQGADPLGTENKLIFALGPVTGTTLMGSSRNSVGAKSPLGGSIALSEVGEYWGAELKRAGYDAIIVEGKAERPVYLWIHDGEVSVRDASHLWGKTTKETQQTIRAELGDDKVRVAQIGPGGENMVSFACIMNGLFDTAGRGGLGAVMGSKNLKAIAVRGHKLPRLADPARFKELRQWMLDNIYAHPLPRGCHELGTGGPMAHFEVLGNLPIRNFRDGRFAGVQQLLPQVIKKTIGVGMEGCYACPVRCKKIVRVDEPYSVDPAYGGPEYEALAALGSNCGIDNLKAVCKGSELCNAYSLDTISTGGVIAFAMECFEKGLLSIKDTGGIELRFGNEEAMLKCIELIARREGIGSLMAEGVVRMAQRLGQGADALAMHVKGLEAGQHDPRYQRGLGLGYMVNPTGADHCVVMHDDSYTTEAAMKRLHPLGFFEVIPPEDTGPHKVALFKAEYFKKVVVNCLVMCIFTATPLTHKQLADITEAVTGWDTGILEQMRVAERVLTMTRLFNIREGFTAADDRLPLRFFQPRVGSEVPGLDPEKMEKAKRYYYVLMGWDPETGVPLPEKVEELGINHL